MVAGNHSTNDQDRKGKHRERRTKRNDDDPECDGRVVQNSRMGRPARSGGMIVFVARHGETASNKERKIQGHADVPLNDKGFEQARKLGIRLAGVHIDKIYCSDLLRAKQTCDMILDERGSEPELEYTELAREKAAGVLQGRSLKEWFKAVRESGQKEWEFCPEGGESWHDVRDRAELLYTRILENHADTQETVLIVSHGGFIKELLACFNHSSRLFPNNAQNCCIYQFKMSPRTKKMITMLYNDTGHLRDREVHTSLSSSQSNSQTEACSQTTEPEEAVESQ
eukprot:Clim_evm18s51 gene=Clim_evmTU18s51